MSGALSDLRVVEMGQLLAGPFAGQLFADFGADVVKLEPPGVGDPMREWGREKPHGKSLWWPIVARGKRSVTCDLRTAEGQRLVKDLVAQADVLIENFRPGTLERWNLSPEALWEVNPRLVVLRVSGFGQTGPKASQAGYGSVGEAMGGLRYVIGEPDRPPARAGISIGDTLAAIFATLGGLMALHARERTGRGQVVDSALYEAVLAVMGSLVTEVDVAGYVRERTGAIIPNVAPSNVYPTADGVGVLIAGNQDTVFRRLAQAMGRPELADDPRYATHAARGVTQVELDALIGEWSSTLDSEKLTAVLEEHGVPTGRVYRAQEMLEDAHIAAREAIVKVAHPLFGDIRMQGAFPKLSDTPGSVRWVGPELGEHTDEVLRDLLGYDEQQVAALKAAGVV
jgi:formyl-CoA transferase